jgi:hypothetical protein
MTNPVTHLGDDAGPARVNVADMPVRALLRSASPVLAASIRRMLEDVDRDGEHYAAFANTP